MQKNNKKKKKKEKKGRKDNNDNNRNPFCFSNASQISHFQASKYITVIVEHTSHSVIREELYSLIIWATDRNTNRRKEGSPASPSTWFKVKRVKEVYSESLYKTTYIPMHIKDLFLSFRNEKLPQHWYEVTSSKVNRSDDAEPVKFPCNF